MFYKASRHKLRCHYLAVVFYVLATHSMACRRNDIDPLEAAALQFAMCLPLQQ